MQPSPQPFRVFLCYRRDDTSGHAGRLYDALTRHFDPGQLFMDIDTIEPGVDFVEVVEEAVGSCNVLLALIGQHWLEAAPEGKPHRLQDEHDFVKLEIEAALDRRIRLIPVLVQGARMPSERELPESIKSLSRRNAIEISDHRWHYDVDQLVRVLERARDQAPTAAAAIADDAAENRPTHEPQKPAEPGKVEPAPPTRRPVTMSAESRPTVSADIGSSVDPSHSEAAFVPEPSVMSRPPSREGQVPLETRVPGTQPAAPSSAADRADAALSQTTSPPAGDAATVDGDHAALPPRRRPRRALLLVTAVVAVLTTAVAIAASQGPGGTKWAIEPNPTGAQSSGLSGVSCASATACSDFGWYGATRVTSTEFWNGSKWTIELPPNPPGASSSGLHGVSCTSATACTAVGHYVNSAATGWTLAEIWNGSKWTFELPPNPPRAKNSGLSGVSCTSATACTAVGHYVNSADTRVTLAEIWNGSKWTFELPPNPPSASSSGLSGVSCTSATSCTAVGGYTNRAETRWSTLAEVWNGSKWTIKLTANPNGVRSGLTAVSCASATACTAVGEWVKSTGMGGLTLAEVWSGSKWAIEPTANPNGVGRSGLTGVSCVSATACTAVGWYGYGGATQVTLVEIWNGSKWAIEPTPNAPGASSLYGVSCTSATACAAVGRDGKSAFSLLS
jgi:hypothetical protein